MPAGVFNARNLRSSEGANPKLEDVDLVIVDFPAAPAELQADRMTCFEATGGDALGELPAGLPAIMGGQVRRRVQAQTRDNGVSVAVTRVDRDPLSATLFSVVPKFGRADRRFE